MASERTPNRLINEKSPYLLQHAYNPVDWWPWCDEAFSKAKAEDKPVFLSIGYSTCHWCHVMERESFEDLEIAEILNRDFISVKVDREEHSDVDYIYMEACQLITGSGGWPLSIFIDYERKPFYAGTYFPKRSRGRITGFAELLERIAALWSEERYTLLSSRDKITATLTQVAHKSGRTDKNFAENAYLQLEKRFDAIYGGFGGAPKFPSPHQLLFLLRYSKGNSLAMIDKTLEGMYRGGIFDHIGGGFSRYSTDEKWLAPHFEKMLYDNALLATAYLEYAQAAENTFYAAVAKKIFNYVLRDMTSPEGGFYSAEDADSEGVEGKFYIWRPGEIRSILGETDAQRFCRLYDITDEGNFEGGSIPNLIKSGIDEQDKEFIDLCAEKLLSERNKRTRPFRDEKILTSWNGLMIAALSLGSRVLNSDGYLTAAKKAADFMLSAMYADKNLKSRYCGGDVRYAACAADYSFLIWGLLELYEACFDPYYLKTAVEIADKFIEECWDFENGGFFINGKSGEKLIARPKEIYDGAASSANSSAAFNLTRLARLSGHFDFEEKAHAVLEAFAGEIGRMPAAHSFSAAALLNLTSNHIEIVITSPDIKSAKDAFSAINSRYLPYATVVFYDGKNGLEETAAYVRDYKIPLRGFLAYVCENGSCRPPVDNVKALLPLLKTGNE